jgi:hypothetical protein
MQLPDIFVSTDIETDGWQIHENSILSIGSAAFFEDKTLINTFSVNLETLPKRIANPETVEWWGKYPDAWEKCRKNCVAPEKGMREYLAWLKSLPGRIIFVGYPIAFDFTFVNEYLLRFTGENPFGFAVIDMRSYMMGLRGKSFRESGNNYWPKRWFEGHEHTHIALEDAIEQGIVFCNMLQENQTSKKLIKTKS